MGAPSSPHRTGDNPTPFTFTPHGMGFIYSEENIYIRVCLPPTREGSPNTS
jgi:hypothetical protein